MVISYERGNIYGKEYFVARPQLFHSVLHPANPHNTAWNNMLSWCIETFGPTSKEHNGHAPDQRWYVYSGSFWFKEEKDLEWFILKWS